MGILKASSRLENIFVKIEICSVLIEDIISSQTISAVLNIQFRINVSNWIIDRGSSMDKYSPSMRIGLLFNIGSIIKEIEGSSSSIIPSC